MYMWKLTLVWSMYYTYVKLLKFIVMGMSTLVEA